jgi:A/G-specific adenine glycosylase
LTGAKPAPVSRSSPEPFAQSLIAWQRQHGRSNLPWQNTTDPYRVWLSEIMLQQTQVVTVLGYYARFLARFPSVQDLAAASQDAVLAQWSGLGYYSRARNLHACAQAVVALHGGAFPRTSSALQTLPGIGRSTAAAIAAFCFGERVAILDANVKRVLARYLAFEHDLSVAQHERQLWQHASDLLPLAQDIAPYTQGLMDLGSAVCTARAAQCLICPVQADCAGRLSGTPERWPIKTRKLKRSQRSYLWLQLRCGPLLWLSLRPSQGIWAGLWSLPEFDSPEDFANTSRTWPGTAQHFSPLKHVLTHVDLFLEPVVWELPTHTPPEQLAQITQAWPQGQWVDMAQALSMGLPAPLRRWLEDMPTLLKPWI